ASPGDTLEYRIAVTNSGNGPATGIVKDTISGNQTYVPGSCAGGTSCSYDAATKTVTWNIGTLAAGATINLTFKTVLGSDFPAGTSQVRNTAVVDTDQEPEKPTNETTTNVTATATTAGNKDVRNVTTNGSFANTASASPGDTLEYRIVVTNTGNATATNVVVTDEVKSLQTYVANSCAGATCSFNATTKVVRWDIASIAPGAANAVTLTFRVTLTGPFNAGTTDVKNVAVVDSATEDPHNTDETTTTVTASPNLDKGVKSVRNVSTNGTFASTATASPGNVLEYQVKVTNNGNAAATNVVITDTIQQRQTYVANSCAGAPCSFSSPTVTWNVGTLAAGASVTVTFRVTLDSVFPAGSTPVKNTAVNDSDQEDPKTSNETTVTVTASPNLDQSAKSVRNVTTNGSYGTSASASPGDTIEYRVVVTNTGNAPATGVVVTDAVAAGQTYVPGSCAGAPCSFTSPTVTWTVGTVNPGSPVTLTFRVTMTGPFNAGPNTINNTASIDSDQQNPKNTNTTTVTVTGTSNLTIAKAADKTAVVGGDTITYTLTYGNTGNATATGTTIVETVPDGTTYVSCSNNCVVSGTTVTWTIGSVAPGQGPAGAVTMTVKVNDTIDQCTICNVARIKSPVQNNGAEVSSNQVCVSSTPQSDPSTANANGDALGLRVYAPLLGIPLVNVNISDSDSSQTGPGLDSDNEKFLELFTGPLGALSSVAHADVLTTTSTSQVSKEQGARQTSTSEVLGLDLLAGAISADVVRSVASTTARGDGSSYSAAGSTAVGLRVLGSPVGNVAPGTKIPLDNNLVNRALYGRGSYVAVNEQVGSTSGPASGQLSGGTYKADLSVTAVRVYITGGTIGGLLTLGGPPVEIKVAHARAHSEHKQTRLCTTDGVTKAVSGHAMLLGLSVNPLLTDATVGFVQIPASGGSASMGVDGDVISGTPANVLTTSDAKTSTTGTNGATASSSSSYATAANVCLLPGAGGFGCLVSATAVKSQANSTASAGSRSSNANGTEFINLTVAGTPIAGTPPPNTVITLPLGLGAVILNEQVADAAETGHTGLTVRAIHVLLNTPIPGVGAEVIVAEAHSDATWR
ncbi:MAG TPA: choice-of-anchor P family protein, partial [Nocardioidaceae bacterium]|nr:choice-of-anchor P family protein [Nocardioidaceae bacterium]